jgi:hypothetical protein
MKVVKPIAVTAPVLVSSTAVEAVAAWSAGTAYAVGNQVLRTTTQRIYQRIIAGTTATAPELDPTNWLDLQPSNTWAMFDGEISTQTAAPSTLTVVLKPGYANSLCLFGLEGTTLTVTERDGLAGPVVYSTTKSLDGTVIADYYQYFFEPALQLNSVVLSNLPPYQNAHITVTIASTGTVKCGVCLVGTFYELGDVQFGATGGIIDYSRKETDTFGVTTFVKRAFSDRITANLMFRNAQLNKVKSVLAGLRATPCAWIGTDQPGFEVLNTFGFYKDFTITVAYPTQSFCALEIEGLT